jgi:Helix-turn-helix domain
VDGFMSASFEPFVWAMSLGREAGLNSTTKAVLVAMANRCGLADGRDCYPSYDRIAADTLLTDRTVQTAVKQLVELGLVTVLSKGDGRGRASQYVLHVERRISLLAKVETDDQGKVESGAVEPPEKVETLTLKVEADTTKVEAASLKVEAASYKPPNNHPITTQGNHPEERVPKPGKGTRLSEDWVPNAHLRAYAMERSLDPDEVLVEFRGWYLTATGERGTWERWDMVWMRWCRNQVKRDRGRHIAPRQNGAPSSGGLFGAIQRAYSGVDMTAEEGLFDGKS